MTYFLTNDRAVPFLLAASGLLFGLGLLFQNLARACPCGSVGSAR